MFRTWTKEMKDFWQEQSLHFRVRLWRVRTPNKRLAMLGLFWFWLWVLREYTNFLFNYEQLSVIKISRLAHLLSLVDKLHFLYFVWFSCRNFFSFFKIRIKRKQRAHNKNKPQIRNSLSYGKRFVVWVALNSKYFKQGAFPLTSK